METKDDRHRCYDNYSSISSIKPNIPDMLTVYHRKETDDLKMNAPLMPITGLRKNNLYILNANNESLNTECGSHPSRKLLFDKYSQIPTIPYPRCNLSGNDCIKRSILYSDKKATFDKLPTIHSASSSDIEYPADEESNACSGSDEKTYSVCETDDTYTVSNSEQTSSTPKVFEKYPDSFDSDSSYLGVSDEDSCSEKTRNVDKGVVDVVEKVINNYHNLLRNFYDPANTIIAKPCTSQSTDETKIYNEIILEPPDMFSDTLPQSSDAESSFQYLSYVNPPVSFDDKKNSDTESSYSPISSTQSTDNIFKSKTALDYVINYLNESAEGFDGKGGISDGSTIEADDLESFYSETDPLNGTLTEQDAQFSFESDPSNEFKIPRVLVSSSDDSRECNVSEGIPDIPRRCVHSKRNERFELGSCKMNVDRVDSRVDLMYSDIQTSFSTSAANTSINELPVASNQAENSSVPNFHISVDLNSSKNFVNLQKELKSTSRIVANVSFNDTNVFINESFDQVDGISNLDQIDPLDSLLFDSWQPIFAKSKPLICETLDDDRESEFSDEDSACSSSIDDDEQRNYDVIEDQRLNSTIDDAAIERNFDAENCNENDIIISLEKGVKVVENERSTRTENEVEIELNFDVENCDDDDVVIRFEKGSKIVEDERPTRTENEAEIESNFDAENYNEDDVIIRFEKGSKIVEEERPTRIKNAAEIEQNFDAENCNEVDVIIRSEKEMKIVEEEEPNHTTNEAEIKPNFYDENCSKNDVKIRPEKGVKIVEKEGPNDTKNAAKIERNSDDENREKNYVVMSTKTGANIIESEVLKSTKNVAEINQNFDDENCNKNNVTIRTEEKGKIIENERLNCTKNTPKIALDSDDENRIKNDVIVSSPTEEIKIIETEDSNSTKNSAKIEQTPDDENRIKNDVIISSSPKQEIKIIETEDSNCTKNSAKIEQSSGDENRIKDDVIIINPKQEVMKIVEPEEENDNIIETCCDLAMTQFSCDNYVNPRNLLENILTLEDGSFGTKCTICLGENPIYATIGEIFKEWGSRYLEIVFLDPSQMEKLTSVGSSTFDKDAATITSANRFLELKVEDDATSCVLNWKDALMTKNPGEEYAGEGDEYDYDYDARTNGGNNRTGEVSSSNVLISSRRFDGMPNPSLCDTVSEPRRATGVVKDKQLESVTGGRQLTDVPVAEHGIHATMASDTTTVAGADDNSSVKNDLDECGCWKSLSNDARPDLRKWRTFPPSLGEIMRSLNSSKLELTGRVPLSELCVFEARTSCNNERFAFAASCIDDCANFANSDSVRDPQSGPDRSDNVNSRTTEVAGHRECSVKITTPDQRDPAVDRDRNKFTNLYVNNLEAIRKFSEYFKTSLETDSKLREGIPDLNLHSDLGQELFTSSSPSPEKPPSPSFESQPLQHDEPPSKEDVTSFIFSESDESCENHFDDMKNKKKSTNDNDTSMDSTEPPKPPGILKSTLKRSKKFYRKKHRVQFDESLNKFFEADYVILVRDEDFDDEYRCECGNQFCYEGCYYEDDDDEEEVEFENSVDSPRFDFAAAFDPPMEFVDPVTLSPPDGYKDGCCHDPNIPSQKVSAATMTAHENQHRKKEASVDAENWQNFQSNENIGTFNEKVKTQDCTNDDGFTKRDQHLRNQRYPFHGNDVNASSQLALFNDPNVQPTNGQSRYIVETITMTTVTERRIVRESANDQLKMVGDMSMMNDRAVGVPGTGGDKYSSAAAAAAAGILKGGKMWRNQDPANTSSTASADAARQRMEMEKEDDKRSVKFHRDENYQHDVTDNCDSTTRPVGENDKEFMLTFKLGNRVVPCNSLKPNSAVRQLFPDPRFVNPPSILDLEDDNLGKCEGKYLVTEESLRAFNEVNKRSVFAISGKERYPYKDGNFTVHSDDEDMPQNDLIKKTIERNTLRRSLMRYPRGAGGERKRERKKKIEPSLEERIKQLTCVDDQDDQSGITHQIQDHYRMEDVIPPRTSPPGEESHDAPCKLEKSSSVSSTYKKFTDLFARNKAAAAAVAGGDNQNEHYPYYQPVYHAMSAVPAQPDLGIDYKLQSGPLMVPKTSGASGKVAGSSNEARKQFLSSLAPLTACVTGHMEQTYGDRETLKLKLAGDRHSITSTASTGTEYSVGDIDDVLAKPEELAKAPQPDVVAGTPSGQDNQDELAMFVQQDASRIERIKKRYSNTPSTVSDDDEHDDYGFSRRPSVRGIKPRFGSTNEILQQMQAQLQQPSVQSTKPGSHMTWPYYSAECGIIDKNSPASATSPRNALPALKEEVNDGSKAEYTAKVVWEKCSTGTMPRGGTSVASLQQPLKIDANNVQMFRLTPSDTITEVAVPYKCEPADQKDLRRFPGGNVFQMKVSPVTTTQVRLPMGVPDGASGQYTAHPIPVGTTSVIRVGHGQQQTFRVPCPVSGPVQVHLLATHPYENAQIRSSSQPIHFPPQIVVAKGTQTSTISTTSFYQLQTNTQSHYQNTSNIPVTKAASEHTTKLIQLNYNAAAQHPSPPISSLTSSPTRVKNQNHIIERGIPEGAVSSSPAFIQDCVKPPQSSPLQMTDGQNNTQNQSQAKSASMMYGMKV